MFENSSVEEIYFASENYAEYFITTKIIYVIKMFLNCVNLKKIIFPPFFNVGLNAREMFKGCIKLEDVNITAIISTEIEDIESMFEDCKSLRVISFSNDFLTGEIKSLNNVFKNTNLTTLDISFLRLYSLQTFSNVFSGASIRGILKLGKYYSNNETRDNFFEEIARVTDQSTAVYVPRGILLYVIFQNIYYSIQNINITVTEIYIDYNINYREDENYIIYSNYIHIGLGWAFDSNNTYDLDSSIVSFDSNIQYLDRVNFQQLSAYDGVITLNGDDLTGEVSDDGDDEEIRIALNRLPGNVTFLTVQLNSYRQNILKDVKSAYIRLSTETDVIGTYSITDAGDNIGLLIGCFSKDSSNKWEFRPLNRIIPGRVVTNSVSSIQVILHSLFGN
jgi:stress response protein SCP2